ncbi:MAG: pilus assembly protein PilM [Vicinamibacterales bacterium]|nr:pilus assembly protein PilM [Vicinamibacterales bacterium]
MSLLRSIFSTPGPSVGIEIASDAVTAVGLARSGSNAIVSSHATEPLPSGAVVPAVNEGNIKDPAAVAGALRRALDQFPRRPRRAALVVPDAVAKVSIVKFEEVPTRSHDLDELVRWQVRKTAPFRIEDAQVVHSRGLTDDAGATEFVVALTRRSIIEEYEQVCTEVGVHAGVVDLSSFNLLNTVSSGDPVDGDWLLVHVAPESSTIAIMRGEQLILFRNRPAEAGAQLADLVHQTSMYYEDRLSGTGFARVFLVGASGGVGEAIRKGLEGRLGGSVESVDPRRVASLADRIDASPDLLDRLTAPIGVLVREHAAS